MKTINEKPREFGESAVKLDNTEPSARDSQITNEGLTTIPNGE